MSKVAKSAFLLLVALMLSSCPSRLLASTGSHPKDLLAKALLGKDVKALLDMPAYKDGIDIYLDPKANKRMDDRGLDLKDLDKFLKEKGIGVARDQWITITDVKIDSDRIEIHLGGGGEGSGASKNAQKKGAGLLRAGGSRINFRYGRDLTDADLQIATFMRFLDRVLDVSRIQEKLDVQNIDPQLKEAIQNKQIVEGMTYQMAIMSAGEPDQKKVEDSTDDSLRETWYYMKAGHRWVVKFLNGQVVKVQIF